MVNINMGTPNHPEGVRHWDWKSLIAFKIEKAWKMAQGYVPPGPHSISRSMAPSILQSPLMDDAIARLGGGTIGYIWNDTNPFFYIAFQEKCPDCESGVGVVDVVRLMGKKGYVAVERSWDRFVPDIGIYNGEGGLVAAIEVEDTSPMSVKKIKAYKDKGVEGYIFDTKDIPVGTEPRTLQFNPMLMHPVGKRRCGRKLRAKVQDILNYWGATTAMHEMLVPFVGIKRWEGTGVAEYCYGVTLDPGRHNEKAMNEASWSRLVGLDGGSLNWRRPMGILEDCPKVSMAIEDWKDALALMRTYAVAMAAQGADLPTIYKAISSPQGVELMAWARY